MALVYLPDVEALFLWGAAPVPAAVVGLVSAGRAHEAELVTPGGRKAVPGRTLPLFDTASALAILTTAELVALPASLACWTLASKLAIELLARERLVPTLRRVAGRLEARWAAALSASEDAARVTAIAQSMPPSAHAVPADGARSLDVWAPDALLRAYLDAVVDALVRSARGGPTLPVPAKGARKPASAWDQRFQAALTADQPSFDVQGFAERSVEADLMRWSTPALGARDRLRACFRLELPEADRDPFTLRFLLQSPDDPSLLVSAEEVWQAKGRSLEKFGRAFRDPQESLLEALGRAARLAPAIAPALSLARPAEIPLDPAAAWTFLGEDAGALAGAGFGVIVPSELTATGQRRLRLRMRVGGKASVAGVVGGTAGLGLDELLTVDWQAVIGDQALTARELAELARHKSSLVRFRGAWVAIDRHELGDIQKRLAAGPTQMTVREGLAAGLAGEVQEGGHAVAVTTSGALADALAQLREGGETSLAAPGALQATLRPYQERGLSWLTTMSTLGLGACLADDMGLGKTIQLIAFLLRRREQSPDDVRPLLLVAPTSVIGNWERELARFAPSLPVVSHYGSERAREPAELAERGAVLVITSYGLLRRDAALLARVRWSVVALDEAQNIKNASSSAARAACSLEASLRLALTGTPVENRLAELWSILEFANPGLLGALATFRRDFAVPIERYANEAAAARLRRVVGPFILRRLKSDASIIGDLPAKNEMKVVCTLTREQATLYKAVVDEELRNIASAEGIARKGRVLALLTYTKQICNHPAQYLSEAGPLAQRSGKLSRITAMLEEAVAARDKALVFTQFRAMGDKLVAHLTAELGCEVIYLHGGTSKKARDELVRRFQEEPHGPRVFILSVKAGGTGLNLTAASHVFHYDRWWNPAVEDQATDRAYRIGQKRNVQVHKLVCAGTVEDKIDQLLTAKRDLAARVVGAGEQWITELGTNELRDLFALSADAGAGLDDADEEAPTPAKKPRARKPRVEIRP